MTSLVVVALASVLAVHWIYPMILRIALDKNIVDRPDDRKSQQAPVPILGGIVVAFGIFVGLLAELVYGRLSGTMVHEPSYPVMAALVVMLYVGAIDDTVTLSPLTRLVVEVLAMLGIVVGTGACIDSLHGLWGVGEFSWWVAVPLTVFAGVGIINAINMIDGVNGLSTCLCMLCNLCFGLLFARSGMWEASALNVSMAASLLPFLGHNLIGERSKMYIGDSGTMVMGMVLSYDVIMLLSSDADIVAPVLGGHKVGLVALAVAILAVPVADTLRVMTMRIAHHRSPFSPDRTHLHHILLDYSHSHSLTTLSELLIALIIVGACAVTCWVKASIDVQFYVVVLVAMILMWGGYAFLASHSKAQSGVAWRLRGTLSGMRKGETRWWKALQEWVDK